jgi:hypothetical protein
MSDAQLRKDIGDLVGVVQKLTITVEKSITNQEHQDKEIDRIGAGQQRLSERIEDIEIKQSAFGVKFKILAVIGTAILTAVIALFLSVTLPVLENSITNKELTSIIKEINDKLE